MSSSTHLIISTKPSKRYYTIDELKVGDYFLFWNGSIGELCIKTNMTYVKQLYDNEDNRLFSNALCLNNGHFKIFQDHKLELLKEVTISY